MLEQHRTEFLINNLIKLSIHFRCNHEADENITLLYKVNTGTARPLRTRILTTDFSTTTFCVFNEFASTNHLNSMLMWHFFNFSNINVLKIMQMQKLDCINLDVHILQWKEQFSRGHSICLLLQTHAVQHTETQTHSSNPSQISVNSVLVQTPA